MRIRLEFELHKPEFSIEYRKSIISFIKNAITQIQDGKKYEEYYKDTIQKDFTWCTILPVLQFTKEKIELTSEKASVIISTDDRKQTGFYLMMSLIKQKNHKYPLENDNFMILNSVKQIGQKIILKNECKFYTMPGAPILVREHDKETNKDRYYSVEDNEFCEKLCQSIKNQLDAAGFEKAFIEKSHIEVIVNDCKKVVVRHYGVMINGTVGSITIKAPEIILQHLYQNGISSRRSAGFGMLDTK